MKGYNTNEQIYKINDFILSKFEASSQTYYSVDKVEDRRKEVLNPIEIFSSLTPLEISPRKLILKVGSPITLIRNLKPPKLCN